VQTAPAFLEATFAKNDAVVFWVVCLVDMMQAQKVVQYAQVSNCI
jgi:hypothetical protein